ncbi:MAG: sugar phosphate isomerase/epimerase family protein [Bryobacteraceae bacterium]
MNRRTFLAAGIAAVAAPKLGAVPRTKMGIATTSFMRGGAPRDTYEFLEYCHSLGAGGIQASLASVEPDYLKTLRAQAEQHGMYIEVMAGLPRKESETFERAMKAAKEVGALCVRAAALSGRRYETFSSMEDWQRFVSESQAAIARGLKIAEAHRVPLALENHKDWTLEEFVALLKSTSSEYLGTCVDTGNNIALLDDANALVEGLAPYAFSTHIKDMGVESYEEGFLLSEVPLGEGYLDLKGMIAVIRKAKPKVRMTLEMITRDPLKVPCLNGKYWVTFPERSGRYLAQTLKTVQERYRRPLPRVTALAPEAQLRLAEENVKQCLHYSREQLGL